MSRIYEAMQRADGPAAAAALPLLRPASYANVTATEGELAASRRAPQLNGRLDRVRTVRLIASGTAGLVPFQSQDAAAEQYRIARTRIELHPRRPRMLACSSPGPEDGKTTTAINLAAALALQQDARVLLVDADFRSAALHERLSCSRTPGISDVLAGDCRLEDAIVRAESFENLHILPAGRRRSNSTELLASPHRLAVFELLREAFRYTILDVPAVGSVADYEILESLSDAILLVVRPDHTDRKLLAQACTALGGDKLLGLILNQAKTSLLWRSAVERRDRQRSGRSESLEQEPASR
jgi:capsular exopolysaccharide synthesis family protein